MEKIPLRRKNKVEQEKQDMAVVKAYFINGWAMDRVMSKFGFSSRSSVYKARNRVNKKLEQKAQKEKENGKDSS